MAGFLTYYLFGMESCDMLSDNYIHEVIKKNNHAFLLGLQGNNLLSRSSGEDQAGDDCPQVQEHELR